MRNSKPLLPQIKQNRLFLICSLVYILVAILIHLIPGKGADVIWMAGKRTETLNQFFLFVTAFGEEFIFFVIIILFALFDSYRNAILFSMGGIFSIIISYFLKIGFSMPRPFKYLEFLGKSAELGSIEHYNFHTGLSSFPSGHSLAAFTFFTLLAFYHGNKRWGIIAFIMAGAVGVSRVYLGQHFSGDVAFGAFLGVVTALFTLFLVNHLWGNNKSMDSALLSGKQI